MMASSTTQTPPTTHAMLFNSLQSSSIDLELRLLSTDFLRAIYLVCIGIPGDVPLFEHPYERKLRLDAIEFVSDMQERILLAQHITLVLSQRLE